jgi:predicted nuclease of restriction endonuclease-like (RecB) superfamily
LTKIKDINERVFYLTETAKNGWSRDTMLLQIKGNLYNRKGQAITNFKETLPAPQSDLAQQTIKDPYLFDFLNLTDDIKERDIENQLIDNVSKFLLELGGYFGVTVPVISVK